MKQPINEENVYNMRYFVMLDLFVFMLTNETKLIKFKHTVTKANGDKKYVFIPSDSHSDPILFRNISFISSNEIDTFIFLLTCFLFKVFIKKT